MLTALTTFSGLVPIIFETSSQAKFLVPIAISLGFGVLISSVALLFVVPSLRMVILDLKSFFVGAYDKKHA